MADATLVDLVKITALTTGTGAVTLGEAVPGYRGREALLDGAVYGYSIQQEAEYEIGRCTYLLASTQIVRTPEFSSNGGLPINLQANASIAFVATAEDILGRDVLRPLYGYGAPTNNIGLIGQTYTDKNEPVTLYGPKTASGWGVGVTLQGGDGQDGAPGPAGNVAGTLDQLKAAPTTNRTMIAAYDGSGSTMTWTLGDFTAQNTQRPQDYVQGNGIPLTTGAWVRQGAESLRFLQATGARIRDTQNKVQDMGVSPRDAPGFVDADVDQMAAVQWAIDKCLASDPPAPLDLAGLFRCDLAPNKSLIVNRAVDQSKARFMIAARGRRAGFRVVGNGNLIDSSLSFNGVDPCSERASFRDVLFTADNAAQAAQTMAAGKFLRISADNCEWENLKFMGATTYAQSFDFRSCRARGWQGNWFEAAGAYAINAEFECKFGGGGMFYLVGPRGITQSSFTRGTYEAMTGAVLTAGGAAGVVIANNYIEYNGAPSIKLDAGIPNPAVTVFGNIFVQGADQLANTNFYDVVWGVTRRARAFGNYCNGRLHDGTQMVGVVPDFAPDDYADIELYKGFKAGLLDQSRAATGNVRGYDAGILYAASGQSWVGLDSMTNALAFGPGVVQAGAYVPIRQLYGTVNPQTSPGFYGNPYWTLGSVVRNSGATGDGQVREWVCTASGQPGVWRAQIMQ